MIGAQTYAYTGTRLENENPRQTRLDWSGEVLLRILLVGNNATTPDYARDNRAGYVYNGYVGWVLPGARSAGSDVMTREFLDGGFSGRDACNKLSGTNFSVLADMILSVLSSPVGVAWGRFLVMGFR